MFAMLLIKATLVSFLWGFVSGLYMAWIGAPYEKNIAIVFGPTLLLCAVTILYGIVVL